MRCWRCKLQVVERRMQKAARSLICILFIYYKQLLDEVFVISGLIKVKVSVISQKLFIIALVSCTGDYRDARALIGRELRHISL